MLAVLSIILYIILLVCAVIFLVPLKRVESFISSPSSIKISFYLINLKKNKTRLQLIQQQAKRENLTIFRFPAIYGKNVNEPELIRKGIISNQHTLHKGELGCALSHIQIMTNLYQSLTDDEYGVIFEDDVIIPNNFLAKLNKLLQQAPLRWDILYLGGCNIKGIQENPYFIRPTVNLPSTNLCAHAYVVKKATIPKLLHYLTPLYRPIDSQWRNYFKDMDVFFANPNLVVQNKEIRSIRRDIDGLPQSKFWKQHQTDITILSK